MRPLTQDLESYGRSTTTGKNAAPDLSRFADKLDARSFIWGAGIECSFIPHLNVDQFEWTQHDRFWRDDLKRAREELGLSALRYALPWHKIETKRGQFDWGAADERVEFCKSL